AHEAALLQSDSIDVYELMADLIAADDQEAVDYIMELMNMANPIDNVNFDENKNNNLEAAERIYYYDESDESKFEKKIIDGREILSLPTFYVTETAKEQKARRSESSAIDKTLLNISAKLYFGVGKSDLDPKYHKDLDNILKILKENEGLGVEIAGYASSEGDETLNRNLSNSRAMSVLEYLNHRGIVRRRIVAKGYGETSVESLSKDESRKVELKIVDLKSMGLY
ncbi:MAG: OmpA family protein, partial [Cyclobacteriaceae bacterium]|nr:OmpA family protein [Cyclobacteriaceae bacterium]